jgi:hypothetical protein
MKLSAGFQTPMDATYTDNDQYQLAIAGLLSALCSAMPVTEPEAATAEVGSAEAAGDNVVARARVSYRLECSGYYKPIQCIR